MIRKIFISLSIILLLSFASCGSGSSKEAKEVLQKILQLVGIPQEIVVNLCQDSNRDGICNLNDPTVKVTVNKKDSFQKIWQKLEALVDGKFLLETEDPTLPILLEIKNNKSSYFREKFTIPFNGFTNHEQNQTKELSILQAMVDAGYLQTEDIKKVKEMENQEKFYANLLEDFEINLKTLTENNISIQNAVLANIKEIAEELKDEGIANRIPEEINDCNGNESCLNSILEPISQEVQIDKNETQEIKNSETEKTKKLLAGKTFYIPYNEDEIATVEKVTFNNKATSVEWQQIYGQDDFGVDSVSIDGSTVLTIGEDNKIEYHKILSINDSYIEIEEAEDNSRLYYNFEDAKKVLNVQDFTKEMLQNKVVYDYAFVEEDGTKGYGKTTFQSEISAIRHEIAISPEGEIVEDETYNINIELKNGQIKFNMGDGYGIWILNNQDSNAWYITMKSDEIIDKTLYFLKPTDFPNEL